MTCPIESTNGIVIECQDRIAELKDCIISNKWLAERVRGEIAGYEWIIYKITGEHYSNFDDDAKYDYPPDKCINGIIERDKFGNPTKTIFDKEEV